LGALIGSSCLTPLVQGVNLPLPLFVWSTAGIVCDLLSYLPAHGSNSFGVLTVHHSLSTLSFSLPERHPRLSDAETLAENSVDVNHFMSLTLI
jgi:hypothetical protein